MKKLLLFLLLLCIFPSISTSQKIEGTYTLGVFGGTPFWNQQSIEEGFVNPGSDFYRLYNNLRVKGTYDNFSVKLSALRNDQFYFDDGAFHFNYNEHNDETKIFQIYGNYAFGDGNYIRAGRFMPLNRWYFRSVDGAAVNYEVDDEITVSAYGGMDVNYGTLFNDDTKDPIGYAQVAYRKDNYGGKLKYMYLNESNRLGFDVFGGFSTLRASLDVGYDFTQDKIFDGSLGLFYYPRTDLSISAHAARYVPLSWSYNYYSHTVERYQAAVTYKINNKYALNFQQLLMNSNQSLDYITYLSLGHRYFYVGLNYVGGDLGNERFGVSVGGNYPLTDDLRISAGLGTVDYLFSRTYTVEEENEHVQSYSSYLNLTYDVLDYLTLRGYMSYYHQFEAMPQKLRGGLTAQLKFEGGE